MDAARLIRKLDGESKHIDRAMDGMFDPDPHALVLHLRIIEDLPQIEYSTTRDSRGVQDLHPVPDGTRAGDLVDPLVDRRPACKSVGGGSPGEFAAFVKTDYERWGDIVRKSGVKLD